MSREAGSPQQTIARAFLAYLREPTLPHAHAVLLLEINDLFSVEIKAVVTDMLQLDIQPTDAMRALAEKLAEIVSNPAQNTEFAELYRRALQAGVADDRAVQFLKIREVYLRLWTASQRLAISKIPQNQPIL